VLFRGLVPTRVRLWCACACVRSRSTLCEQTDVSSIGRILVVCACVCRAREFCSELGARMGVSSIYAEFSRLFVDPNRELSSNTLIRTEADRALIQINRTVCEAERERRVQLCYHPFHAALANLIR
jgi:N-formylglutamate amidohydrolase